MSSVIHVALAANQLSESFRNARFDSPKNFIVLRNGRSLLEHTLISNLKHSVGEKVCLLPREQLTSRQMLHLKRALDIEGLQVTFIGVPETPSAFATLLWAADFLDENPVRVVPGDALVRTTVEPWADSNRIMPYLVVAQSAEDRWGFVDVDPSNRLRGFEPKNPISNLIATGEYGFTKGSSILDIAKPLLSKQPMKHPHIGQVFLLTEKEGSAQVVSSSGFIPLASPGDVRAFDSSSST